MKKTKIGLLPLYIKLYDDYATSARPRIDKFHDLIAGELVKRGLDVVRVPVCRIKGEFKEAIRKFEAEEVDAIVTLHLAYSPSLKSADVLAKTKLPIIVCDTTPTFDYDPETDPEELMYNHGIHGVQDMCNLLRRNKRDYQIFAGHWSESDVLEKVVNAAKGARLAKRLRSLRIGMVGEAFSGMGDFSLGDGKLEKLLGFKVIQYEMNRRYPVTKEEIAAEYTADSAAYDLSGIPQEVYDANTAIDLQVRKWVEDKDIDAFTVNFLATSKSNAFPYMPFCSASKAMRDGIGYAGEGDVMTAALVGTFIDEYPETSFTEMFCPDWRGNSVFLSHMGEQNLNCIAGKAKMVIKPFPYTDAEDPIKLLGTFKPGKVIFVCLAPQADDRFALIAAEGEMLEAPETNRHTEAVNGWFKPASMTIAEFLENYSKNGGIHHAALIYDGSMTMVESFAKVSGFDFVKM